MHFFAFFIPCLGRPRIDVRKRVVVAVDLEVYRQVYKKIRKEVLYATATM